MNSDMSIIAQTKIVHIIGLSLILSACSAPHLKPPTTIDTAPDRQVDVNQIPDAVPKPESLSPYGNPESYVVFGKRYYLLNSREGYKQRGIASWYGTKFHGKRTSSGEPYDMFAMTAAHKTLPIPAYARVTNLENGRRIIVKINDRGPFVKNRIIDLSYAAAKKLGITARGTAQVEVETIVPRTTSARHSDLPVTRVAASPMTSTPATIQQDASTNQLEQGLYLQMGLFRDRENAEKLRQDLLRLAQENIQIASEQQSSGSVYRVRIGPLQKEEQAQHLLDSLAEHGHQGFRIRLD